MTPKQSDWTNNWFDALEAAGEYSALFVKYMTENYGLNTADVHAVAFSYTFHSLAICRFVLQFAIVLQILLKSLYPVSS